MTVGLSRVSVNRSQMILSLLQMTVSLSQKSVIGLFAKEPYKKESLANECQSVAQECKSVTNKCKSLTNDCKSLTNDCKSRSESDFKPRT